MQAAQSWELVKPQAWLHTEYVQLNNGTMSIEGEMSGGEPIGVDGVTSNTIITANMLQVANFEQLEHVTIRVWIQVRLTRNIF